MRSYARRQLKQDAFAASTAETISWAVEHRSKLIAAGIVAAVILAVLGGSWAYVNYRDQQAKADLALAIQKYSAPIRPAGAPATPDVLSYGSAEERAKATHGEFSRIASKYRFTQSAQMARYFAGVTARDLGDNAAAAKDLQEVAGSRYPEIASLAKMALAAVYHDTNRNLQAVDIYRQLIDHPTDSVGKSTAQLALASLYESMARPDEARHIYEQMQKESPASMIAQIAGQRLQALSKQQ
ncbi:MAG TPA: tetratricopeptide repeat protein [Candidatus Binatia bacterium]|nr:tetratricopeptide repeat protein [Candidatus Binatia bacterium]